MSYKIKIDSGGKFISGLHSVIEGLFQPFLKTSVKCILKADK